MLRVVVLVMKSELFPPVDMCSKMYVKTIYMYICIYIYISKYEEKRTLINNHLLI